MLYQNILDFFVICVKIFLLLIGFTINRTQQLNIITHQCWHLSFSNHLCTVSSIKIVVMLKWLHCSCYLDWIFLSSALFKLERVSFDTYITSHWGRGTIRSQIFTVVKNLLSCEHIVFSHNKVEFLNYIFSRIFVTCGSW